MTGDEPQGTMGRVHTAGETTSRPLSPSRHPLRAHFHQERDVWVRGRGLTVYHSNQLSILNLACKVIVSAGVWRKRLLRKLF